MNTALTAVWLLLAQGYSSSSPVVPIRTFTAENECAKAAEAIKVGFSARAICISVPRLQPER